MNKNLEVKLIKVAFPIYDIYAGLKTALPMLQNNNPTYRRYSMFKDFFNSIVKNPNTPDLSNFSRSLQ